MDKVTDEQLLRDGLGMSDAKIEETLANSSLVPNIRAVIAEGGDDHMDGWSKSYRAMIYDVATRFPKKSAQHRPLFMSYVGAGKVPRDRMNMCCDFFKKMQHKTVEEVSAAEFEEACGIGIEVSAEEVESAVAAAVKKADGWGAYGITLGAMRRELKFADALVIKETMDRLFEAAFGPRSAAKKVEKKKGGDKKKGGADKPAKKDKEAAPSAAAAAAAEEPAESLKHVKFHKPEENLQMTDELLAEHLKRTGGRVRTRFPPEPNGYLHLGHVKSMNLNFGYAAREGGVCFLRFDDTNPTKEKHEYIDTIMECVHWMGFKPYKITYASDYFEQLFDFAIQLINEDKAFVCHETADEMHTHRENGVESRWRNRPTAESLKLFHDMRKGKFDEGTATLRLKMDMKSPNPNMRDTVAYRIKFAPHPRTGDKWCIYPTYDYTHCICDSLEDITHSLCTLEFDVRRESYEWLVRALGIYCPPQIEFSRLNVSNYLMSKRRIIKLVESGIVRGWDDPRLATIVGLRRRGYTPEAMKDLCERVGITRAENLIDVSVMEDCARNDLNANAPRAMAVLDPIRVVCENFDKGCVDVTVPNFPSQAERGSHTVPFSGVFYIDRSDFMVEPPKGYFRLSPGGKVGLRHVYITEGKNMFMECTGYTLEEGSDRVREVTVKMVEVDEKPKKMHYIQFVAEGPGGAAPQACEFRLYEDLFTDPRPSSLGDDWMRAINPTSEVVLPGYVDAFVARAPVDSKFQFERVGYFTVDPDSRPEKMVCNRVVSLRAAAGKVC